MSKITAQWDLHDLIARADARLHRAGYDQGAIVATDEDLAETADLLDEAARAARSLVSKKQHDVPKGKH